MKDLDRQEAWLCLRFTALSLNSLGISFNDSFNKESAPHAQPAAITQNQQIWQCNQAALDSGISIDMSVNHALMLIPEIYLTERDERLEAKKRQELSYWAYRFTSLVSLHKEHSLLLEIGRSINLFSGLEHLINLIRADLGSFDIQAKLGIAETPKAAYALSFSDFDKQPQLSAKPSLEQLKSIQLQHLDIDQKVIAQLHNCGFATLRDIHSIPNAELGQRFGATFLHYLEQLWGHVADPQTSITPPETFEACADFAEPIRNLNWINQQLDRLLNDLVAFVQIRQLVCRSFTWRFYHENNRLLQTVTIGLSAKQNTLATFRQLTDLKLASIQLEWEFSSIELSSKQLVPMQLFNNDLFDPQPDQQQFNQLIDKLSNRLGNNALFRIHVSDEHLPELRNDRQNAVQETTVAYTANTPATTLAQPLAPLQDQPLWLLENPQRLAQQQRQPLHQGPLSIIHGPDRITSHWWSKLQSRDYFIARQRDGRLLWIFFDRGAKSWFLHGLFA